MNSGSSAGSTPVTPTTPLMQLDPDPSEIPSPGAHEAAIEARMEVLRAERERMVHDGGRLKMPPSSAEGCAAQQPSACHFSPQGPAPVTLNGEPFAEPQPGWPLPIGASAPWCDPRRIQDAGGVSRYTRKHGTARMHGRRPPALHA